MKGLRINCSVTTFSAFISFLVSIIWLLAAINPFLSLDPDLIYEKSPSNFGIITYLSVSTLFITVFSLISINWIVDNLIKINNIYIICILITSFNNVFVLANLLVANETYQEYIHAFEVSYILKAIWLLSLLATIGISIFYYLLKGNQDDQNQQIIVDNVLNSITNHQNPDLDIKDIKKNIVELENKIKETTNLTNVFSSNELDHIKKQIKGSLSDEVSNEILSNIEKKFKEKLESNNILARINGQLSLTRIRLNNEISNLSKRGNLNLIIGIITSFLAISVLASAVYNSAYTHADGINLYQFLPKLALSIFIETFSFFFLGLYRNSLKEIKYYQNELTNIDFKFTALENTVQRNETDSINKVIQEFTKTERNFILEKGQSTINSGITSK